MGTNEHSTTNFQSFFKEHNEEPCPWRGESRDPSNLFISVVPHTCKCFSSLPDFNWCPHYKSARSYLAHPDIPCTLKLTSFSWAISGYLHKTAFSRLYLVHSFSHSQGQGLHTRMFITGINFHEHKVPRGFDSSFFAYYVLSCELFHYLYSTLHGYIFPRYHHISAQSFQAQSLNTLQNPMYHQIQRRDSTRLDPYSQSAYVVNRTPKTNHWNYLWLDAFVPKCFSRGVAIEHPKNSIHPDLNTSSPHLYHCISAMVSG